MQHIAFSNDVGLYIRAGRITSKSVLQDGSSLEVKAMVFGSGWSPAQCDKSFLGECRERNSALSWDIRLLKHKTLNCPVILPNNSEEDDLEFVSKAKMGLRGKSCLVPAECVWLNLGAALGKHKRHGTSNGLAAGDNYEHAAMNGALELLERDAVLRWWWGVAAAGKIAKSVLYEYGLEPIFSRYMEVSILHIHTFTTIYVSAALVIQNGLSFFGSAAELDEKSSVLHSLREACTAAEISKGRLFPSVEQPKSLYERQIFHASRKILKKRFANTPSEYKFSLSVLNKETPTAEEFLNSEYFATNILISQISKNQLTDFCVIRALSTTLEGLPVDTWEENEQKTKLLKSLDHRSQHEMNSYPPHPIY